MNPEVAEAQMESVAYACKFCRRPGVARYAPGLPIRIEKWVAMLACNPCADYHSNRAVIEDTLWDAVRPLLQARRAKLKSLPDIEAKARDRIEAATKRYSELVTSYYRLANFWDQEFPSMIMDKPEKLNQIVKTYRGSVRAMSRDLNQPKP